MRLLNFDLLRNPYNWIVVWLMVAVAALAFAMLDPLQTDAAQGSPA